MRTNTKNFIDPLKPKQSNIDIEEIAESLSNTCRFNGHCKLFYSVAEHSLNTLKLGEFLAGEDLQKLTPQEQLQFLLHDATEAYVGDLIKPLKNLIPLFEEIENRFWKVIAKKYKVPVEWHPLLDRADKTCYAIEATHLRKGETFVRALEDVPYDLHPKYLEKIPIWGYSHQVAKNKFLATYASIIKQIEEGI
jgi:5'-deoxynucleotidase YfbR-like HD superfamily hydrolase